MTVRVRKPLAPLPRTWEIGCIRADPATARIEVRVPVCEATEKTAAGSGDLTLGDLTLGDVTLGGHVIGPTFAYGHTLTAKVPLSPITHQGGSVSVPSEIRTACATVPDPCFWTPDLPFLYSVQAQLARGKEVIVSGERTIGIRPLGVRGRFLTLAGKNWVPRGVLVGSLAGANRMIVCTDEELCDWRAANAAMVVDQPSDELCDSASRLGVAIIAWVQGSGSTVESEICRLSAWPSVVVVVVEPSGEPPSNAGVRRQARNVLIAQHLHPGESPAPWADLVACNWAAGDRGSWREINPTSALRPPSSALSSTVLRPPSSALPIMVVRRSRDRSTLSYLRAACDVLQRDLAGSGEFAGYIV